MMFLPYRRIAISTYRRIGKSPILRYSVTPIDMIYKADVARYSDTSFLRTACMGVSAYRQIGIVFFFSNTTIDMFYKVAVTPIGTYRRIGVFV